MKAFFPEPPETMTNPIMDVVVVLYRAELVAPNLTRAALGDLWSLAPLAVALALMLGYLLLFRGTPRRALFRPLVPVLALALLPAFFGVVRSKGASYSERKQSDFVRFVRRVDTGRIQSPTGTRALRP